MSAQNLIIYKFSGLYQILEEIGLDLNFKIFLADSENSLNEKVKNLDNKMKILANERTLYLLFSVFK